MKKIIYSVFDKHVKIARFLMVLLTIFLLVLIMPKSSKFKYEFNKLKPWLHKDLIAPFDYSILKSDQKIKNEEKEIRENAPLYYKYQNEVIKKKQIELKNTLTDLRYYNEGTKILNYIFNKGVIDLLNNFEGGKTVLLYKNDVYSTLSLTDFFTIQSASTYIKDIRYSSNKAKKQLEIPLQTLLEINVKYEKYLTDKHIIDEMENIALIEGRVQYGELIVAKGQTVDADIYQKLVSLKKTYESKSASSSKNSLRTIGYFLLCSILTFLLVVIINSRKSHLFFDTSKLLLILFNFFLFVALSIFLINFLPNYLYIIPFCLLPITLKAFLDDDEALYTHLFSILLISFNAPNPLEFILLQFSAGFVLLLSSKEFFKRSYLFKTSFKIIGIYLIIYFGLSFIQNTSLINVNWQNVGLLIASGMLTLFSFPLIYVYERFFGLLSEVTLFEMTDTNSPLLKQLAEKAPGTFQHSLQVSSIAESVANSVGANSMMVRAGALYHDVGKMKNPLYFIENQSKGINPHNEITFEESAEIIIKHVSDGVELAKKNNIPDPIIDFIRSHHGTSMVNYFYKKHLNAFPEDKNLMGKFKYRGPKPFSKETAILMMADAVEAASRSLIEITQENIDSLVESIVNGQMNNLQFENADITFKEIKQIKKILKKKLLSINHIRRI